MQKIDIVHAISCGFFSKRDSIAQAIMEFDETARSLGPETRAAMMTALFIVTNTIAAQIEKNEEIDKKKNAA